jgi:hypothetical protein
MPYGMLESKNKDGTQWRMKTVYDLMRHHTALEVICGNCPNTAVLSNRFLSRHYGMMKVITELRFVCRRCWSQRYRLRLVPDHLGEKEPLRMQWFRGVYEKHLD